jgi:hypothetical protein
LAAASDIVAALQDYQARFNIAFAKAQPAGARSLEDKAPHKGVTEHVFVH